MSSELSNASPSCGLPSSSASVWTAKVYIHPLTGRRTEDILILEKSECRYVYRHGIHCIYTKVFTYLTANSFAFGMCLNGSGHALEYTLATGG